MAASRGGTPPKTAHEAGGSQPNEGGRGSKAEAAPPRNELRSDARRQRTHAEATDATGACTARQLTFNTRHLAAESRGIGAGPDCANSRQQLVIRLYRQAETHTKLPSIMAARKIEPWRTSPAKPRGRDAILRPSRRRTDHGGSRGCSSASGFRSAMASWTISRHVSL